MTLEQGAAQAGYAAAGRLVAPDDQAVRLRRRQAVGVAEELVGLLGGDLVVRDGGCEDVAGGVVDEEQVEVGGDAVLGLVVPELELHRAAGVDVDHVARIGPGPGIPVVAVGVAVGGRDGRSGAGGRPVGLGLVGGDVLAADDGVRVGRGGEVGDARCRHVGDGLGDDAVLVDGLVEVRDVVDDDLGPRGGEVADLLGEVDVAVERGGHQDRGARSQVVDGLGHAAGLVGAAARQLGLDHHGRRVAAGVAGAGQLAVADIGGGAAHVVVRVRQDTDLDAGPVDAVGGASGRRTQVGVALGDDPRAAGRAGGDAALLEGRCDSREVGAVDRRGEDLLEPLDAVHRADGIDVSRFDGDGHEVVRSALRDDPGAGALERGLGRGIHRAQAGVGQERTIRLVQQRPGAGGGKVDGAVFAGIGPGDAGASSQLLQSGRDVAVPSCRCALGRSGVGGQRDQCGHEAKGHDEHRSPDVLQPIHHRTLQVGGAPLQRRANATSAHSPERLSRDVARGLRRAVVRGQETNQRCTRVRGGAMLHTVGNEEQR